MKGFALAVVVVAALAGAAIASESYVELENWVKHSTTYTAGVPQYYLVEAPSASSSFNVRVYRHDRFNDATTQLLLCWSTAGFPGSCARPSASSGYDVTILSGVSGKKYYFALNQSGASQDFSYEIELCSGGCFTECLLDCSGHGSCDTSNYHCECDEGYASSWCSKTSSEYEDWEKELRWIIIGCVVGFFLIVLLPVIVALLCCCGVCCVGCCAGSRTRYQPINHTAPPPQTIIYTQQQQPYQQQYQQQPYQPPTPVTYTVPPTTPTH